MPKTAKTKRKRSWHPEACESCRLPYDSAWGSDYSMSGELVWICPKCGKQN